VFSSFYFSETIVTYDPAAEMLDPDSRCPRSPNSTSGDHANASFLDGDLPGWWHS